MLRIYFREKALRILKKIERKSQSRISSALDDLKTGQFASSSVEKIQGTKQGRRLRVGRWRVLFSLLPKEKRIEIVDIFLKKGKGDYHKAKKLLK